MNENRYEPTEIVAGWSHVSLADVCSIMSGGTPPKGEPKYWNGDIPWVSGKDIKAPRLRDSIDHVSREAVGSGTRMAPAGSVFLLVRGMGLAKDLPVAVALRPMTFNQDIKALVPKDPKLGPFIRAAIYHGRERLLSRVVPSAHGTMTLSLDDVERFQIAMPNDVEEAIAIGAALELVRERQELAIEGSSAIESLRRSAMQALFTRGLRGGEQKETVLGPIPEDWDVAAIGDVAVSTQYGLSVRGQTTGTYPILRMNCQENGAVHYRNLQFVDLDQGTFETFRLKRGDLLFNRTNSIELVGRMAIVDDDRPAVFASYLVRLTVDGGRCIPRFLNHFMNWPVTQAEIKRFASRAVGQANINASKLRLVSFPLPSLNEQREIVAVLDAIEKRIDLDRQVRTTLEDLFKALLQKLMTGEIRVADLDLSVLIPKPSTEAAA
jgi:type I restriction enzyme S subunit